MWKRFYKLLCHIKQAARVPLYHYVIVRRDLPLGTIVAQTIHAAGESSPGGHLLPSDTRAVALAVPDEAALVRLEADLTSAGISFRAIREPDPPHNGALMAIGLNPCVRDLVRPLLAHLELVR